MSARWMQRVGVLILFGAMAFATVVAQDHGSATLYKRIGGYDAVAAVVDGFLGRLLDDSHLARYFTGHSIDSMERIRQHIVDQICAATGGPCVYKGRDMKRTHHGLGISEDHWNRSVNHLVATMEKFKVPEKEKGELLAAISSMKKDIVE